jgi:hypothetical protein
MRSRAVRVTLSLLAIAAIGTAGYFYWITQKQISGTISTDARFNDARSTAARAVFDLRSAQQAYVAPAQNETFWFDKATACVDALRSTLPALEGATGSVDARTALAEAAGALQDFEQRDRRIRGYVSSGQKLLASDIIFSDGLDAVSRIVTALERAAAAAAEETRAARRQAIEQQVIAAAAAAVATLFVLLLLTPPRGRPAAEALDQLADSAPAHKPMLELDLRPKPLPHSAAAKTAAPLPASASAPKPPIELDALARVCTDLARLSDSSTIPAILERTASALDASGIVLWIADGERHKLTPAAAHGYGPSVLARMGSLRVDAENATAAAFRTGLVQTVAGGGKSSGAIAAPLVSPAGPVGVISAEMRHNGEKISARLAAATIVAAQLATILGPSVTHVDDRSAAL